MDEIAHLARPEIYALKPYSSARSEGPQGNFILLDANENPYRPFPGGPDEAGLNRYPEPQPAPLIARFAEIFQAPSASLFLSRGADEAIDLLVRAFCRAGVDAILVTPPTFVMYETAAAIQDATVVEVPLDADFQLDVEAIVNIEPKPKLVFFCSPGNPTAKLLNRNDIIRVADALLGHSLVVIDHIYIDFADASSLADDIELHPNLVVLRSMSKEYSLTGERMGITIAHSEVIGILRRIMAPYSLTASSIRAVEKALTDAGRSYGRQKIADIKAERERVRAALAQIPLVRKVYPSDANFLLVEVQDAAACTAQALAAGIKIRDRSSAVANCVRISIGTPTENDALLRAFSQ